jgi:hypothetical protein
MILSALALLMLVTNVCLINSNRNMQTDLGQRQAVINNSGAQSQLNQALVQALAQSAVSDDDKSLRDLLQSQGISIKKNASANGTAAGNTEKAVVSPEKKK